MKRLGWWHRTAPRTKPYLAALQRVSARTGTPLPSLVLSFAILHELTVLVPLAGVFFGARAVGAGDKLVGAIRNDASDDWATNRLKPWVDEGEAWAGRIGTRYGAFGIDKGEDKTSVRLAGDVANAVLAYGVVKAILPLRIGLSLWLAPAFSRGVVERVRRGLWPSRKV